MGLSLRDAVHLVVGALAGLWIAESRRDAEPHTHVSTACAGISRNGAVPRRRLQAAPEAPSGAAPAPFPSGSGVHMTSTALFSTLHLAHLDQDRQIVVPSSTRKILIEIGCSDRDTMDVDELARNDKNASHNDSFLIAFEPLLDKYATLLSRATSRYHGPRVTDRATPLGHHHPRGVILPLAVAPHGPRGKRDGLSMINVSRIAGCSSLVAFNENNTQWGIQCHTRDHRNGGTFEARYVPTIGIEQALRLAPAHLPIEMLKLDAQGLDFKILRAAGTSALRRVSNIELEVVKQGCPTLYAGQETHNTVKLHLQSAGFELRGWKWHGYLRCEGTGFFGRREADASHWIMTGHG